MSIGIISLGIVRSAKDTTERNECIMRVRLDPSGMSVEFQIFFFLVRCFLLLDSWSFGGVHSGAVLPPPIAATMERWPSTANGNSPIVTQVAVAGLELGRTAS